MSGMPALLRRVCGCSIVVEVVTRAAREALLELCLGLAQRSRQLGEFGASEEEQYDGQDDEEFWSAEVHANDATDSTIDQLGRGAAATTDDRGHAPQRRQPVFRFQEVGDGP